MMAAVEDGAAACARVVDVRSERKVKVMADGSCWEVRCSMDWVAEIIGRVSGPRRGGTMRDRAVAVKEEG